jgi:hypothetical protein
MKRKSDHNEIVHFYVPSEENNMTVRITGFSDFVQHPEFYKLENTTFRKPDLFPWTCFNG